MNSSLASYLTKHAGWFVFGAWLLAIVIVLGGLRLGVGLIIVGAYSADYQLVYPIHGTILAIILVAIPTSLLAAIGASLAFALRRRFIASTLVLALELTLIGGAAIALIFTPQGPQELFSRHVGDQRFLLPRRYKPPNDPKVGFDFVVCLRPFGVPPFERSQGCQSDTLVSVRSRQSGLEQWTDVSYWKVSWREMQRLDDVMGYEAYLGG